MVILYNLNREQYLKIINYLYKKCDTLAFALPNHKAKHYSTAFIDTRTLEKTQLAPGEVNRENEAFIKYKNNVSSLINELSGSIREVYTATNYFGELRAYEVETYILTFNESVLEVLKKYENFSVWRFPNLPEDFVFYNYINLVASAVTHENEISIYDNSKEFFDLLEEADIYYVDYDADQSD